MTTRQAKAQAKHVMKDLGLGNSPTLISIQQNLEQVRGKKIQIRELSTLNGTEVCGLWLGFEDRDVILHASVHSSWHRQQIILHEFAHILLGHGHTATPLAPSQYSTSQETGETPTTVFGRSSFEDESEATAEYLADLLAQRIMRHRTPENKEPAGFTEVFG